MHLFQFDSEGAWCAGVASFWRDRLHLKPGLRQCLASGNTPIPIFREMARSVQQGLVSFKQSIVFALDEFGELRSNDPGTCRNMLTRDLIGPVDLPNRQFHFLNAAAPDLEEECQAYDQAVGNGFDLVLLGIGLNGHLGMNEPGSSPQSCTRRVDLHQTTIASSARYLSHGQLPKWGLTVGMAQFFASKEVWLVATGQAKAEIVRRLVHDSISTDLPASLMRRHPNCALFVDPSAGALLGTKAAV